ncbi:uncharacterized protein LOC118198853 [Stegodyphus dumicola]|uniref:uncharacterized protein LOC118198853 n=1 Tax=Stegodyphus dumicola TaxID=202533 RepID=UPI0015B1D392|nr:uncharacterized protein LOC118198853 [Stegodyphus dumicola]
MVCQIYSKNDAEIIKEFFFGDCKCRDCSLPYGTSILTKVIDETKAHTVIKDSESILDLCSTLLRLQVGDPKIWLFLQEKVKIVLKKQEGVLGNTNILRLRLLAWKCLHVKGPPEEQVEDLEKLAEYVELAFGENYIELRLIYSHLIDVSRLLLDNTRIVHYIQKLCRLQRTFDPDDPILNTLKFMNLLLQGF